MSKTAISSPELPAVIGPYSPAVLQGNTLYVSGQLPADPQTGAYPEGVAAQTEQCLRNLQKILETAGFSMRDVVKATVYLADMRDFGAMNEVYARFFEAPYPARAALQVVAMARGALVEIDAVAAR